MANRKLCHEYMPNLFRCHNAQICLDLLATAMSSLGVDVLLIFINPYSSIEVLFTFLRNICRQAGGGKYEKGHHKIKKVTHIYR
jgi:hypothetical protein